MSEQDTFADFLRRLRAGDEQAAADVVRRYEGVIRREARLQMTDPRRFRLLDSIDVSQSVLTVSSLAPPLASTTSTGRRTCCGYWCAWLEEEDDELR
jgi:hypothetical protein